MESNLVVIKDNIKLWNIKVPNLKDQQEITKKYLTNSISNLQIANEHLQKMEIFMADMLATPRFINQIIAQSESEEELSTSLPFFIRTLDLASRTPNLSFVYNLYEMVNDPDTKGAIIWSKSGTSFFIRDEEGLEDHVLKRFNCTIKVFKRRLNDYGFRCVDHFLCEYTNENFQRDNKHMLMKIRSKKIVLEVKKNIESDMEEELNRLKFFQNELKENILNIKDNEQIIKYDILNVKMCLEDASKMIAQQAKGERRVDLLSVDSQLQEYETGKLKQDIGKIKQDLWKLNIQILNLEQGCISIESQLAAIERIFLDADKKQEEIKLSMKKVFIKKKYYPWTRARRNKNNKKMEISGIIKKTSHGSENTLQTTNGKDHNANPEKLTTKFESQESKNICNYLMEDGNFSYTDIRDDDLVQRIELLESELILL